MNLRPIQNADLKVTKGWSAANGSVRVHVSLKGAAFVNKTYWLREAQLAQPVILETIKGDLHALLKKKADCISRYTT